MSNNQDGKGKKKGRKKVLSNNNKTKRKRKKEVISLSRNKILNVQGEPTKLKETKLNSQSNARKLLKHSE